MTRDTQYAGRHRTTTSCGGCDSTWSGLNIAHCTTCHRTFTTARNFDTHRKGSKTGHVSGVCSDPAERGLLLNDRGQWALPGRDA